MIEIRVDVHALEMTRALIYIDHDVDECVT